MKHRRYSLSLVLTLIVLCASPLYPIGSALRGQDLGFIFSTRDILLGLDEYQGGIGVKLAGDRLAYRGLLDVFVSTVDESFSGALGLSVERHLQTDRVSPYIGACLTLELAKSTTEDAFTNTRTERLSMPISSAAIFGVELFLARSVSLFAEYSLSLTFSPTWVTETVSGVEDKRSDAEWSLDMGLGNQSKIGIVVYFVTKRDVHLSGWAAGRSAAQPSR